jgi:4-hydroxybenzoate polyprenyltransferase
MIMLARLNLLVAANVTALALSTQVWWSGYVPVTSIFTSIFCGTLLVYFLLRIKWLRQPAKAEDGITALFYYENRKLITALLFLTAFILLYLLIWKVPFKPLGLFLPALIPVALYHAPMGGRGSIRHSGILKLLFISFSVSWITWAIPTLSFPPAGLREPLDWGLGFLARLFFIFGISVPFDVRDMEEDRRKGLKTLALMAGEKAALRIGAFACLASGLTEMMRWMNGSLSLLNFIALGTALLASGLLVLESKQQRKEGHFSIILESTLGLMAFLLWALRL